ncbi:hypothetical protein L3X38_001084 [Prunus dulcis]|uniref:Uncharacterized protein n=1 Tax=Prunus dulcis TaxID=3755 RepID=A0AAD4WTW0_PRUDU|nr:hypothetical protein L3X38_001084 [Prunus dulcis]
MLAPSRLQNREFSAELSTSFFLAIGSMLSSWLQCPSAPPSSFGESAFGTPVIIRRERCLRHPRNHSTRGDAFGTLPSFGESDAFGTPVIIRQGAMPSAPCHHSARAMPSAPPSSFGESAFGTRSSFGESDAFGTPVIIRRECLRHPAIIRPERCLRHPRHHSARVPSAPGHHSARVPSAPYHHSARAMPSAPLSSFGDSACLRHTAIIRRERCLRHSTIIRGKCLRHPAIIRRERCLRHPRHHSAKVPSAPRHHLARAMPSAPTIHTTLLGRRLRCCSVSALKITSSQPRSTSLLKNLGDFCLYHI